MTESNDVHKTFATDQSMFPDRVWQISFKIGIMPDDDHVQMEIETRNARTDELMELYSIPHVPLSRARGRFDFLNEWFTQVFDEMTGPFLP
uniref:Uncharacterized protein n=1 Tax=uncultured prokaryote TaxID=198431 RepID=A0A0H5QM33_9ZZZZ|nr:hypothetical protein [uncultured prokaryote]